MALVALIIGAVLIVAAFRNSQGALAAQLGADVPGFVVWAAAIVAVGVVGMIPALRPFSKGLLILVVVVLLLTNYQAILAGFSGAVRSGQTGGTAAKPSTANASDPLSYLQSFGNLIGSGASLSSGASTGGGGGY